MLIHIYPERPPQCFIESSAPWVSVQEMGRWVEGVEKDGARTRIEGSRIISTHINFFKKKKPYKLYLLSIRISSSNLDNNPRRLCYSHFTCEELEAQKLKPKDTCSVSGRA